MAPNTVRNNSDCSLVGILNLDGSQKRLVRTNGYPVKAKQIVPRFDLVKPGKPVCLDIEGSKLSSQQGVFEKGLGRIAMNVWEEYPGRWFIVYDTYIHYDHEAGQKPGYSKKSGVYEDDLLPENYARPISEVMKNIHAIFQISGVVVGHSMINEQQFLRGIPWQKYTIFDTQLFSEFVSHARSSSDPRPALRDLSAKLLHRVIQERQHDPNIDVQATGDLFYEYESSIRTEQDTPGMQQRLLWKPNAEQIQRWNDDATFKAAVEALGDVAWRPKLSTVEFGESSSQALNVLTDSSTHLDIAASSPHTQTNQDLQSVERSNESLRSDGIVQITAATREISLTMSITAPETKSREAESQPDGQTAGGEDNAAAPTQKGKKKQKKWTRLQL